MATFSAIWCCSFRSSSFIGDISSRIPTISFIMSFCGFSFAGIFSRISIVLARAVFTSVNPRRMSSAEFGALAPSRLRGCAMNSTFTLKFSRFFYKLLVNSSVKTLNITGAEMFIILGVLLEEEANGILRAEVCFNACFYLCDGFHLVKVFRD